MHTTHTRNHPRTRANVYASGKARMARKARTTRTRTTTTTDVVTKECPFLRAIGASEFVFPATTEFFYRDKSTKDGLAVWSKAGEKIYNKGYTARKALSNATTARDATRKGTKARTEANVVVAACEAKVAEAEAMGAFKYGRVARTHGSAVRVA